MTKLSKAQVEVLKRMAANMELSRFSNATLVEMRPLKTLRALERRGLAKVHFPAFGDGWVITELGRAALKDTP
jgi:hypothetical protein